MKKKIVFTALACVLALLFAWGVWAVGARSDNFGIDKLKREAEGKTAALSGYRYGYRWDPEEDAVYGVDVEWVNGTVEIRPTDARLLRITEKSDGRDLTDSEKLKLSSSGGVLKISWDKKLLDLAILENTRKDLIVEIPRSLLDGQLNSLKCANTSGDITLAEGLDAAVLELSSTSGNIALDGFQGEKASVSTVSGGIQLRDLAVEEELEVRTVSGQIFAGGVCGTANLKTTSGEIVFEGSAGDLGLDAVSANARVDLFTAPKTAVLSSVSGDLTVRLQQDAGFTVDYDTVSGKFSSELPLNATVKDRQFTYGDGRAKLSFTTTGGDMILVSLDGTEG